MPGQKINVYFTGAGFLVVSSLEPLYENHPPLIACQRPCPRPTKSQLLTVGPGATFETKAQLILCCKG